MSKVGPKNAARLGIIGWPVSHSRSPLIHNYWLETIKREPAATDSWPQTYERCPIDPAADFAAALDKMAAEGFIGANVTLPHKENAFAAMDAMDDAAAALGAVNTISFIDGKRIGRNTDGGGFIAGLDEASAKHGQQHKWRDNPVLVLGAGGAARAIIVALAREGVPQIKLVNRTSARAEALKGLSDKIMIGDWDKRAALAKECHLLVNTTSLGMTGASPLDMDLQYLADGALVSDIVYAPLETDLLARARRDGFVPVDGLGMLLHQAALAFEVWTGVLPPVSDALRQKLVADLVGVK